MTFQNASPNGYSIILVLGRIVTIGFFIGFMVILLKKRLGTESKIFTIIVFDVYGNQTELPGIRINFKNISLYKHIHLENLLKKKDYGN